MIRRSVFATGEPDSSWRPRNGSGLQADTGPKIEKAYATHLARNAEAKSLSINDITFLTRHTFELFADRNFGDFGGWDLRPRGMPIPARVAP